MTDRITRWLVYAILVLILAILTVVFYVVWMGVLRPHPPRTSLERDLQRLEAVVEAKPQVEQAWRDYLRALISSGQYSKAHRVVEEGRAVLASDSAVVDVEEARLLHAEGSPDEAIAVLDAAIELQTKVLDAYIADLSAKGITATRASIMGSDVLIDAYILKAQVMSAEARWQEAAEAYSEALDMSPSMADVMTARGFVYVELGENGKAEKDFKQALEFDPELEAAKAGLKEIGQ